MMINDVNVGQRNRYGLYVTIKIETINQKKNENFYKRAIVTNLLVGISEFFSRYFESYGC